MDSVQCIFLCRIPSRKTIYTCGCNLIMKMEIGILIRNKLFYLTNSALIRVTMMAEFFLNAMPEKTTFRSATSNIILNEYWHLWSAMRLHNMDNRFIYEFWASWTIELSTNFVQLEQQQLLERSTGDRNRLFLSKHS